MRTAATELVKYTAASGAALAVDVGLLALLVSGAGVPYLLASAISFAAGGVFLYFFCIKLVFRYRRVPNPALELPLFVVLGLVGLAVNCLAMYVSVTQLQVGYLEAKGVSAVCTFGINFALRRLVMFSRSTRPARPLALAD